MTWNRGPANSWLLKNPMKVELMSYCPASWMISNGWFSQQWDSRRQWYITLKEILCELRWYQKLNSENLALAPGFAGKRHIYHLQVYLQSFNNLHKLSFYINVEELVISTFCICHLWLILHKLSAPVSKSMKP